MKTQILIMQLNIKASEYPVKLYSGTGQEWRGGGGGGGDYPLCNRLSSNIVNGICKA
jgi:hypothetical protein